MKLKIEIDSETLTGLLETAPRACAYWGSVSWSATIGRALVWERDALDDESDPEPTHDLWKSDFQRALMIMADKYPHHLANIIRDNWDDWTADALIQCACFGELRYG